MDDVRDTQAKEYSLRREKLTDRAALIQGFNAPLIGLYTLSIVPLHQFAIL